MEVIKTIHKALSDKDIRDILGDKCKIIKYSELSQYNSLSELLPELLDYVILLYEESINSGHWVALLKYNNVYEFFDAYGLFPDKQLLWMDLKKRQFLHQRIPYLTNLLKQENYIYNKVKYQNEDNFVNTCGSHVAHRIYRLINNSMTLEDYHEFMLNLSKESKFNYDMIVSTFVNLINER
jgi:hypothetical protein